MQAHSLERTPGSQEFHCACSNIIQNIVRLSKPTKTERFDIRRRQATSNNICQQLEKLLRFGCLSYRLSPDDGGSSNKIAYTDFSGAKKNLHKCSSLLGPSVTDSFRHQFEYHASVEKKLRCSQNLQQGTVSTLGRRPLHLEALSILRALSALSHYHSQLVPDIEDILLNHVHVLKLPQHVAMLLSMRSLGHTMNVTRKHALLLATTNSMAEACLTLFKDKLGPGNRHHPLFGEDSLPNSLSETSATVIKQEPRLNDGRLAPINRNVRSSPSWELRRGSRNPRDSRVDELCRQALMLAGGLSHQLCSKGEMMDGHRLDVQLSKSDWLLWSTSFETATLSGIKRASARDLAFSAVALASMKVRLSSQWLDTLGSRTAELLCTSVQTAHAARDDAPTASSQNSVSAVMAPTFSSLVHLSAAAAALGCKVDSTSLAACTEAGGIASATHLRRLPPVILADLCWALVVMGGRPDPMWAAAFLDSSHCCIVCMSPQQLIRCLQTLVLLGLKPYDLWLRDMELRLLHSSCAGQASCEDIVTYLSCLKKIKRVPDFQTGTRLVHELKRLLPRLQHEEIQSIITSLKSLFPKMRDKGMKALTHEMARRCKELLHQDAP